MASENTDEKDTPPGGAPVSSSNQKGGKVMPIKRSSSPVEMTVVKDSEKTVKFDNSTVTNASNDVVQNGLSNGHQFLETTNSTSDDEKSLEKVTKRDKSSVSDSPEMKERTSHVPTTNGSVIDSEKPGRSEMMMGGVPVDVEGVKKSQQGVDATNTPRDSADSVHVAPEDRAVAYSPDKRFLKYDIEIGRGSFKTVYKGLDTETGVAVAWCELQENRYNKAEQVRFKEEVAILKTLQHPNILKLYDSWEVPVTRGAQRERKVLVLVTELMTSGTLKAYMRRMKAIKPRVIRSWGRQILRGLYFLQTRTPPIIHRDLKCDNIFINGTTGLVKIGDLGLATLKRSEVKTVIGTPEFMAPEMYEENYDESVDVYAFGMCLLEMCTQEYPYMECSNPAQIYKRVSQGIKPNAIDKVKDPVLRKIIDRCTTVDKKERYTVKNLIDHEFFLEGFKIEAIPQEDSTKSSLFIMRMEVPSKETSKSKGQETIEFPYDLNADNPDSVVDEMVKSGILGYAVSNNVLRSLREYVDDIKQKRQPRKDLAPAETKSNLPIQQQTIVEVSEQESVQPKFQRLNSSNEGSSTSTTKGSTEGGVANESVAPVVSDSVGVVNAEKGRVTPSQLPVHDQGTNNNSSKQNDLISPPAVQQKTHTLSDSSSTNLTTSAPPGQGPSQTVQQLPPPSSLSSSSSTTLSDQTTVNDEKVKTKPLGTQPSVTPSEPQQTSSSSVVASQSTQSVVEKQNSEGSLSVPSTTTLTSDSNTPPLQTGHIEDSSGASTLQVGGVQVDKPTESTPVHQLESISTGSLNDAHPPQMSTSTSDLKVEKVDKDKNTASAVGDVKNGTLKKKPQRAKKKQLSLTFIEVKEGVVKCKLVTSAGNMVNFQFSIKYDKPEAIVVKFVKAGHIAHNEVEEFIQQANRMTSIAKNRTDSVTKDATKSEQTETKQRSDSKTTIVPVDSKILPSTESTPSSPSVDSTKSTTTNSSSVSLKISSTESSVSTLSTPSNESQVSSVKSAPSSEYTTSKSKNGVSQSVCSESRSSHTPEPIVANKQGSPPVTLNKDTSTSTSIVSTQTSVITSVVEEPATKTVTEVQETAVPISTTTAVSISSTSSSQIPVTNFGMTTSTSSVLAVSNASVCPIPSTDAVAPLPLPVCTDVTYTQPSPAPMVTRVSKKFEIADVTEEADSPEQSDFSAHSSTENLDKDLYVAASAVRSDSHDSNPSSIVQGPSKKYSVQNISSLDCPSDSSIGIGGIEAVMDTNSVHSLTPEPGLLQPSPITTAGMAGYPPLPQMFGYNMYPPLPTGPQQMMPLNITQRTSSVPYGLSYGHQFPDQHSTSLGLPPSHYRHHQITSETYKPYATMNLPYTAPVTNVPTVLPETISTDVERKGEPVSVTGQQQQQQRGAHVQRHTSSTQESLSSPSEDEHYPTMADVPHAQLLSKAFMRFLYSMSTIFRDPSFKPLMESLDHQFGPTHVQQSSIERVVPQSAPPTFPPKQPHVSEESSAPTLRSNTDPGLEVKLTDTTEESDRELNEVLAKFEEEQKLLDQRKQEALTAYHKKKRGSAGSSSTSSSKVDSPKSSIQPQSPAQSGRTVSLHEYEVQSWNIQGQSSSAATNNSSKSSLGKDKVDEMEKRVKEEILAEFPTSPGHQHYREDANKTTDKRISPTISPPRNERDTQSTSFNVGGQTGRMQELISPPPPSSESRHQRPRVGSQSSYGQQLPTSPPPASRTSRIAHSDSNEWTEYTSATPVTTGPRATTPMSASGTRYGDVRPGSDISEFDPIALNNPS